MNIQTIQQENISKSSVKTSRRPMVKFEQTKYCYYSGDNKEHWHLGPFSLEIFESELLVILGPSGSGKTTLMRLIAGLESPRKGEISIDGQMVFNGRVNVLPEKRQVGLMFQDHVLFPHLTVRENILFGIEDWSRSDRERRLLELKGLLRIGGYLKRYPHELSGGQQQRVTLARTLAPKPKVILLDEPLSNIDADLRTSLAQELRDVIKQTGSTAVWVTHDQTEAFDIADRVAVLKDGNIEQLDTPLELYHNPNTRFVADFIGQSVFIEGEIQGEKILTEIGEIPNETPYDDGMKVEVMVRPDDVYVVPHDAGIGIVSKRQFRGSQHLYTITLPSGQDIYSHQSSTALWPVGGKVNVSLRSEHVVVFSI